MAQHADEHKRADEQRMRRAQRRPQAHSFAAGAAGVKPPQTAKGAVGQEPYTPANQAAHAHGVPSHRARPQHARSRAARSRTRAHRRAAHSRVGSSGAVGFESAARPGASAERVQAARSSQTDVPRTPIIAAILAFALLLVLVFLLLPRCSSTDDTPQIEPGQQVEVAIPEGAAGATIAQILKEHGIISSIDEFFAEVQKQNADQSLKSGTYSLITGAQVSEVVKQLVAGPNSSAAKVTIAEGLTVDATARVVEDALSIPASEFVSQAQASRYSSRYDFLENAASDSLEGFLFPKTYDFSGKELTADTVITSMLDQYATEAQTLDWDSARAFIAQRYGLELSNYDLLTLASVVEREVFNPDDRPKVASVFYNRLTVGMNLQSDATMMYVTGGVVTADDLKIDSPYNSYLYAGLPPTPICSPSVDSIQATLNPADTNYYYFYLEGDFSAFSETYEEHNEVIEQLRASHQQAGTSDDSAEG